MFEGQAALVDLLLFEQLLARNHDVAAFLVELDNANFDLLANVAVKITGLAGFRAGSRAENALMPMSTVKTAFDASEHRADDGSFFVGCALFDRIPHPVALGFVVAEQEAAFGFFALDHNFHRVAGLQFGLALYASSTCSKRNETLRT